MPHVEYPSVDVPGTLREDEAIADEAIADEAIADEAIADDVLIVQDRFSRRRFIRTGAAFALTGTAVLAAQSGLAADCDRGGEGCESPRCSDADTGENSDPQGRGRHCSNITISERVPELAKIRG